ncbi:unnamed protein product [Darwinula stevensoni]|uniref:Enkurin domain-containing protein n=1 Tax=Darwinula stevensoni TaxID=69355 RepID=A0A7R8X0W7_9CRUS|nr:unnamed protein product [Darwinula stevensoni]CAG0881630.1 unnamed protein product [Darwinula stevensoni]
MEEVQGKGFQRISASSNREAHAEVDMHHRDKLEKQRRKVLSAHSFRDLSSREPPLTPGTIASPPSIHQVSEEVHSPKKLLAPKSPHADKKEVEEFKSWRRRNPPKHPIPLPEHYKRGAVPRYLKKRKEEIKAEIAAAQHIEDSDLSGAIPEKERLETLQKLIQKEAEVERALASLPLSIDTLRVKKKRQELEHQLTILDEGIRLFSRSKVFLRNNMKQQDWEFYKNMKISCD